MSRSMINVPVPREPQLSEFRRLIREGAGTLDIHDDQDAASPFTRPARAGEALVDREVGRVRVHLESICRLLERNVGAAPLVLDVGCGTGATTVALALSSGIAARKVVGVDPNEHSLAAAKVRWDSYSGDQRVEFQRTEVGQPLLFASNTFNLTLCVSVIEYVGTHEQRRGLVQELLRVTKPGGHVCIVTPNPFKLFAYHTGRLLGDLRRTSGYPWAPWPWELERMFAGHRCKFLLSEQLRHGFERRHIRLGPIAGVLAPLAWLLPWQKLIAEKAAKV